MNITVRNMTAADQNSVLEMMRVFYASPAVWSSGSEEIFRNDIENCINDNPYLEGFVIEDAGEILGYVMVAKSYSTEFGKRCIWIEDIYLKEECRNSGIGSYALQFIINRFPNSVFRLEVEEENTPAIAAYQKNGFSVLPYMEMKK